MWNNNTISLYKTPMLIFLRDTHVQISIGRSCPPSQSGQDLQCTPQSSGNIGHLVLTTPWFFFMGRKQRFLAHPPYYLGGNITWNLLLHYFALLCSEILLNVTAVLFSLSSHPTAPVLFFMRLCHLRVKFFFCFLLSGSLNELI